MCGGTHALAGRANDVIARGGGALAIDLPWSAPKIFKVVVWGRGAEGWGDTYPALVCVALVGPRKQEGDTSVAPTPSFAV